jgi:hypothetical protein
MAGRVGECLPETQTFDCGQCFGLAVVTDFMDCRGDENYYSDHDGDGRGEVTVDCGQIRVCVMHGCPCDGAEYSQEHADGEGQESCQKCDQQNAKGNQDGTGLSRIPEHPSNCNAAFRIVEGPCG